MSDGWTNGKGRTLLNFLVHCSQGNMFIKLVDVSTNVKGVALLREVMDGFIQEIGLQHVVQIISSYLCVSHQVANGEAPHSVLDSMCYPLY